jgi:hypothetical protein
MVEVGLWNGGGRNMDWWRKEYGTVGKEYGMVEECLIGGMKIWRVRRRDIRG